MEAPQEGDEQKNSQQTQESPEGASEHSPKIKIDSD
jgi:hypothetical protein